MRISYLVSPHVVTISREENVAAAARLMSRYNLGCLPVLTGEKLSGVVTDRDIVLRCIAPGKDPAAVTVGEIMSKDPVSVPPETDSRDAGRLMATKQLRRLAVVDKGRLVGMLSLGDLAASDACDLEASRALCEISSNIRRV